MRPNQNLPSAQGRRQSRNLRRHLPIRVAAGRFLPVAHLPKMQYGRTVIGYHGCDATTARQLFAGANFKPSQNDYDWLGHGIYFWEYGPDRAYRFATKKQTHWRKVKTPTVIGALINLGNCFDLLDTRFTADLGAAYPAWRDTIRALDNELPANGGRDRTLRKRDCAVLNWYLDLAAGEGKEYDTVRCAFQEGPQAFEGSAIHVDTHIQIAVRNPSCILGVFSPTLSK
jgi:hypothetical protein